MIQDKYAALWSQTSTDVYGLCVYVKPQFYLLGQNCTQRCLGGLAYLIEKPGTTSYAEACRIGRKPSGIVGLSPYHVIADTGVNSRNKPSGNRKALPY